MDNSVTNKKRILLNAEPFGFGPTAAIADCFPFLREHFGKVGYVGVGFTLDLQRPLPYDSLHDVTGVPQELLDAVLADIFSRYDLFLTALDFGMAEKAKAAGLTVVIYDPLTWYWKTIPPSVKDADLYIAQDFFGVRERIAAEPHAFGGDAAKIRVVPPIIGDVAHAPGERNTVLLNLGGLNNPFWSAEGTLAYARLIVEAFASVADNVEVVITANKCIAANARIAAELAEFGVKNLSRSQMQEVLKGAKFALMTPGLGNVYDAARFDIPTIWLPPANDSQGQQLFMLLEADMVDGHVDWHHLLPGKAIDYSAEQTGVLKKISAAVTRTCGSKTAKKVLERHLAESIESVLRAIDYRLETRRSSAKRPPVHSLTSQLVEKFGAGGAREVARLAAELVLHSENSKKKGGAQ
jgi:hypothetical protein